MFETIAIKEKVVKLRGSGEARERFEWRGWDGKVVNTMLTLILSKKEEEKRKKTGLEETLSRGWGILIVS